MFPLGSTARQSIFKAAHRQIDEHRCLSLDEIGISRSSTIYSEVYLWHDEGVTWFH